MRNEKSSRISSKRPRSGKITWRKSPNGLELTLKSSPRGG